MQVFMDKFLTIKIPIPGKQTPLMFELNLGTCKFKE